MKLTDVLRDQRQEMEEFVKRKRLIKRESESLYEDFMRSGLIKVITGVRRCGKSVFARMLMKDRKFAYMNFDDERIADIDTDDILSSFYEIYGKDIEFILLDEIQNLEKWELFANRLKRMGMNLVITGSNSKLLSRELSTHLTGRHMSMELYPFSFREYLNAMNISDDCGTTRGKAVMKRELSKYIDAGGFPEVVTEHEMPGVYARELYTKILERDIIGRYGISYKKTFREIAITLLSNPGRSISYNKLKRQFNMKSEHTVKNYVSYLEEAYLIFILKRISRKPVEIEKSNRKVYVIDTSVIKSLSGRFSSDYGRLYENVVAIDLLRRMSSDPLTEIYYWKNQRHQEVDFVVKHGLEIMELIQVCHDISDPATKDRETRALLNASDELGCENLLIITEEKDDAEEISGKKVKYIPLWKWLLETPAS